MLYYELFQIKKSKLKISMVYTITLQVAKRQKFEFDEKKSVPFNFKCVSQVTCRMRNIFNNKILFITFIPQINNNTDRRLDVVFQDLGGFSFTITLRKKPKGVNRMLSILSFNAERAYFFWLLTQLFVVNEIPLNLEKTT